MQGPVVRSSAFRRSRPLPEGGTTNHRPFARARIRNQPMNIFSRQRLWMGTAFLAGLAVVAGFGWALWPAGEDNSYADAPFEKVGPSFPRIIPVSEPPPDDPQAQ